MQALTLIPFAFWLQHGRSPAKAGGGSRPTDPDMTSWREGDAGLQGQPAGSAGLSGADPDHPEPCEGASPRAGAPGSPPSLSELQQAMAGHLDSLGHAGAEPLRWAITGIDPQHGLRIEGIGLHRAAAAAGLPGDPATNTPHPRQQQPGKTSGGETH